MAALRADEDHLRRIMGTSDDAELERKDPITASGSILGAMADFDRQRWWKGRIRGCAGGISSLEL